MHQSLIGRLQTGIDVSGLNASLKAQPDLWNEITARQDHPASAHKDTKTIFLRWAKELSVETVFTDIDAVNYRALKLLPEAGRLIAEVLFRSKATALGRVIITSLKPGGLIEPHADEGAYADYYERFHIPLSSEPGNQFVVQHSDDHYEAANMKVGELWWFNHKKVHHVYNGSRNDRVHLIVDAVAPLYRRERDDA